MANFTDEGVSVELAFLVVVHLDTRLVVVDTFGDHAVSGETLEQLLFADIFGQRFHVDGRVDSLLRLFVLLLLRILLRMSSVVVYQIQSMMQRWSNVHVRLRQPCASWSDPRLARHRRHPAFCMLRAAALQALHPSISHKGQKC